MCWIKTRDLKNWSSYYCLLFGSVCVFLFYNKIIYETFVEKMCNFSEVTSFVTELSTQFFGCVCDLVSMEMKAVVSGKLSNELCLCRSVIFDWLGGAASNVFSCCRKPAIYKNCCRSKWNSSFKMFSFTHLTYWNGNRLIQTSPWRPLWVKSFKTATATLLSQELRERGIIWFV